MNTERSPLCIYTDVTADLNKVAVIKPNDKINPAEPLVFRNLAKELGIVVIPAYVTINGEGYLTDKNFDPKLVDQALTDKKSITTAAPSPEFIKELFEQNPEQIICLHVGSKLSVFADQEQLAVTELNEKNNRENISLFDSGLTSAGLGLLAIDATKNTDKSSQEILERLGELKERSVILVAFKSLERPKLSGRLKGIQAIFVDTLNIKAAIFELRNSKFSNKGLFKSLNKLFSSFLEQIEQLGALEQAAIIIADEDETTLHELPNIITSLSKNYQGDIYLVKMGPALKTHTGFDAIAIAAIKAK